MDERDQKVSTDDIESTTTSENVNSNAENVAPAVESAQGKPEDERCKTMDNEECTSEKKDCNTENEDCNMENEDSTVENEECKADKEECNAESSDQVEEPPQKRRRKMETFLQGEQVPYLYESLRGKDIAPPAENSISFSDPVCDEYLEFVARTGRPLFDWKVLKSFILWKVECVMLEMEQLAPFDHRSAVSNTDRSNSKEYVERILSASALLPGVPFTIQRICELLIHPRKHYKRADKFYRALEKNVAVVTTVDKDGRRETDRQPEIIDEDPASAGDVTSNSDTATTTASTYNHT